MMKEYGERDAATLTRGYTATVCNIMARKEADRKFGGPRYFALRP